MDPRPEVLITAAREDGEALARSIRGRLEDEHPDIELWPDRAEKQGSRNWWKQITAALDVVEVMVLGLTAGAIASPIVRQQWRLARRRGVRVYPVRGKTAPPDPATMPRWMSQDRVYDLDVGWNQFVHHLKRPGRGARVPFMAPELPAGFVARPREFDPLRALLLGAGRGDPVAPPIALVGAGGFGKTTLAAALCHDDDVMSAFGDGILWVTLGQSPDVPTELARLHKAMTGEDAGFRDVEQAAQALATCLEQKRCLIVVDDAREAAHLQPFLREGKTRVRLITTREISIAEGDGGPRVDVAEMTTDEAVRMLTTRLDTPPAVVEPVRALASRLGGWPLALELVGAALRVQSDWGDPLREVLDHIHQRLDEEGVTASGPTGPQDPQRTIAPAIGVSPGLLRPVERRSYLELAIFAEGLDIPFGALGALWDVDAIETEVRVRRLAELSLLACDLPSGTVRLHDVVRAHLAGQLTDAPAVHARLVDAWGDAQPPPDPFARRWMAYHLVGAGRRERLGALLLDFSWLQAKLEASHALALLADFERLADDADLKLVQGAIRLSVNALAQDKSQLRGQLYGRLLPCDTPAIRRFREQIVAANAGPWLRPLTPSLAPPEGAPRRPLEGHAGGVFKVAELPDGRHALSASDDRTLKLWDLPSGRLLRTLECEPDGVTAMAVLLDGRHALGAEGNGTLRLWDLDSGRAVRALVSPAYGVRALEVLPDGQHALSGSDDGTMKLWDLESGRALRTLVGHVGSVTAVAALPNGRHALSASSDGTLKTWDLDSGRVLDTLERHAGWVFSMAVLPNGRYALCAMADGSLKLWNLESGRGLYTLEGHTGPVLTVMMLPDGYQALSASYDGTLRLWDLDRIAQRASFQGDVALWSCAVAPDGRTCLAGDAAGRVHFLRLEGA